MEEPENWHKEQNVSGDLAEQYFDNVGTIMVQLDTEGRIERINKRGRNHLGYDDDELVGENWFETVVPPDITSDVSQVFEALLGGENVGIGVHENYVLTKSGERRLIKWHNSILRGDDGEISGILASGSDITESRQYERQLKKLSEEYQSVVDNADDAIFLIDVEKSDSTTTFRYRYLNPAHEKRSGLTSEQVQGNTPKEVFGSELGAKLNENYLTCIEAGDAITYYEELDMPEGNIIWQTNLAPVVINGTVTRIVGIARDLTERIDRENELRRKNKRLDEFASVLSHDIRNPLNVAQGWMGMIERECQSEHVRPVIDALDRMEDMIEDTLTLACEGDKVRETESINISEIVDACWSMVETEDSTVEIQDEFTFLGDPVRIQHILENLFRNAIQHGGKAVSIRIGKLGNDGFYVEDDGSGIPTGMNGTIFDPGQTSAEEGTGFGLTIVRRVTEAHGWTISVTESESGGVRFQFHGVEFQH